MFEKTDTEDVENGNGLPILSLFKEKPESLSALQSVTGAIFAR